MWWIIKNKRTKELLVVHLKGEPSRIDLPSGAKIILILSQIEDLNWEYYNTSLEPGRDFSMSEDITEFACLTSKVQGKLVEDNDRTKVEKSLRLLPTYVKKIDEGTILN